MQEIARYSGCFVCGEHNQAGLKAKFFFKDGRAFTECVAEKRYEGYHDVYHGGITATLLDEVMIKALLAKGIYAMTVELNVRFHKAIFIGRKLFLEGYLEKQQGRLFVTKGEVRTDDGTVVASASGKYLRVTSEMRAKLMKSLET